MASVAYNNRTATDPFTAEQESESNQNRVSSGYHLQRAADLPSRLVRAVQTARRRRGALFNEDLFSDPAWDILLELYALHLEQRRASVSSVYEASSVPGSTALRWIAKLERDGLLVRVDDPLDARRSWVKLSEEGVQRMRRFFEMWALAAASV